MTPRSSGVVRVAVLALLWGSTFLFIKLGLETFTPVAVTLYRIVFGAATLGLILVLTGSRLPPRGRVWGHLTVAALFGNVLPYLLFGIAEQAVASAAAGMINATTPLWTVLITVVAHRRADAARDNMVGLLLGFVGVALIFSPWEHGGEIMSRYGLACMAAALSYGVSYVYIGRYLAGRSTEPLPTATGQLLCALGLTTLVVPVVGVEALVPTGFDTIASLAVVALGVAGTGLTYLVNYQIIARDGAAAASVVTYLLPVVALALGFVVVGERIDPTSLVGAAIVLVGVSRRRPVRP